jgi:hypothetical protein
VKVVTSEPTHSIPAKGHITTDIIISDLPDDIIAALDAIAERCAMTREDFIAAVLFREARTPWRIVSEKERQDGYARLAGLLDEPHSEDC